MKSALVELAARLLGTPVALPVGRPFLKEVVVFPRRPSDDTRLMMTNGLSEATLAQADGHPTLRQELAIIVEDAIAELDVLSLLGVVAQKLGQRGRALKKGEVLGPAGPLVQGSKLTALYATSPVFLPETFAMNVGPGGHEQTVWLIPISDAEAARAREDGADEFHARLEALDLPTAGFGFLRQS